MSKDLSELGPRRGWIYTFVSIVSNRKKKLAFVSKNTFPEDVERERQRRGRERNIRTYAAHRATGLINVVFIYPVVITFFAVS